MRMTFISIALILGLFAFQNAYSEGVGKDAGIKCDNHFFLRECVCTIEIPDSFINRYVFWRVYTQETNGSTNKWVEVKIDSILRENFYAKAKWRLYSPSKQIK